MVFIPLNDVLNISIILIMIIAFVNSAKKTPKLFQLVDYETNQNYNDYLSKTPKDYEIKMSIYEYNRTIYNIDAERIPSPSVKSFEDYVTDLNDYCTNPEKYKEPELTSSDYGLTIFENAFKSLLQCLSDITPPEDPSNQRPSEDFLTVPQILIDLKDVLNTKNDSNYTTLNFNCCVPKIVYMNVKVYYRVYDKISKKLNDKQKEKKLYKCILNFKNQVIELNQKYGKYTKEYISKIKKDKKNTNQLTDNDMKMLTRNKLEIVINEDSNLSKNDKKQILEKTELDILNDINSRSGTRIEAISNEWCKALTKNKLIKKTTLEYQAECKSSINIMDDINFKITKLSYIIYPSLSESNLNIYKMKRIFIVKYLKLFDNNNTTVQEYDIYEAENNNVDKNYFALMKTCRAISEENDYNTYVLRLKNNECIPLPKTLWEAELITIKGIKIEDLVEYQKIKEKIYIP